MKTSRTESQKKQNRRKARHIMKAKKDLGAFTHRVPENSLGYFAMHCCDNQPLPPEASVGMIEGPLKAMQPKLSDELAGKNDHANEASKKCVT
jgi:hypothetical protein